MVSLSYAAQLVRRFGPACSALASRAAFLESRIMPALKANATQVQAQQFQTSRFVNRRVTRRARLPPALDPQPLVRITLDVIFDFAGESLRVLANVLGIIPSADQLHLRIKT